MTSLDNAHIHFSAGSLWVLNIALAFLMFAVSLFIEREQVADLRRNPRALAVGLLAQWLYMPVMAVLLVVWLRPPPGLALGMLLVAACPGGNVSNYLSMTARANVVLAISLVTISTIAAALATPGLFALTAKIALSAEALPALQVDFFGMLRSVFLVVAAPLLLGALFKSRAPALALRIRKPLRTAAGLLLLTFIAGGLADNFGLFLQAIGQLFGWVFLLNTLAIIGGYALGALFRLPEADRRALAIETGIHNSGLGLVLIFNFFDGAGPMALIAAWWGVWDITSGAVLAAVWSRRPLLAASATN
ncbi:MAG: bile acid:sodium symporter family protein [Nevskiaceae bacterium]|nr:MAG: bile acid:sodium symporter family protein [Nevskiaceae bacterium]